VAEPRGAEALLDLGEGEASPSEDGDAGETELLDQGIAALGGPETR
jgi:hypothetical protein